MWFGKQEKSSSSRLFNEKTFYKQFIRDLKNSRSEVIIESPYLTATRIAELKPILQCVIKRGIKVTVITREPSEHQDLYMRDQSANEIMSLMDIGVEIVMLTGGHHRKLAIIDRKILWEGSLNILSHNRSLEVMRRFDDRQIAKEMLTFLNLSEIFS